MVYNIHPKLTHLSENQIENLIKGYYEGVKVAELLKTYSINAHPCQLFSFLPPMVVNTAICKYCNIPMISKRPTKDHSDFIDPYCPKCNHKNEDYCYCVNCNNEKQKKLEEENRKKREILFDWFGEPEDEATALNKLNLKGALYFLSLLRLFIIGDYRRIRPLKEQIYKFAPTPDLSSKALNYLNNIGLIEISYYSPIEAFGFYKIDEEINDWNKSCNMALVAWDILPGKSDEDRKNYIIELEKIAKTKEWTESWKTEIYDVWKEICLHECFEYYKYIAIKHQLNDIKIDQKTIDVFSLILDDFSVSQIYYIIFKKVVDCIGYGKRKNIPNNQLQNILIGSIQQYAEKIKAEGWYIKGYGRDFNCKQSIISETFFNAFLGVGEAGFKDLLSKYKIFSKY